MKKSWCVLAYVNPTNEVRGKTRRYLYEVKPNVFVGTVSTLVRETLWNKIKETNTLASIIYSANNEQGFKSESTYGDAMFSDFDGVILPTFEKSVLSVKDIYAKSDGKKLIDHLLEAGYIAHALLTYGRGKNAIQHIAKLLNVDVDKLIDLICFLIGTHDVGKAHPTFQLNLNDSNTCCDEIHGTVIKLFLSGSFDVTDSGEMRHERYSRDILYDYFSDLGLDKYSYEYLADIVAFHHQGKLGDAKEPTVCYGSETEDRWKEWKNVQKQMIEKVRSIWNIDTDFISSLENKKYTNGLCYFILSVMVTSDWIVSGKHWARKLYECGNDIEKAAVQFITENELCYKPVKEYLGNLSWSNVFPFSKNDLQKYVTETTYCDSNVCVIEYPCGYGKTEAALALALKLGSDKSGIYLGAPTMSTAKGLARRCRNIAKSSGIDMNIPEFDSSMIWEDNEMEKIPMELWTSKTRHQMLYPFAVGTIDQILKSVIKYRYSCIGMLGLSDKVVIIDEVHAYDAYMLTELKTLIRWCNFLNVPVILLSATLPTETKQQLFSASGITADIKEYSNEYPLITYAYNGKLIQEHTDCVGKDVNIKTVESNDIIVSMLNSAMSIESGCIALIAPTVDDAFALYDMLNEEVTDCDVILYHGRMSVSDKSDKVKELLRLFGKDRSNRPKKAVVVATSIIEQSLDVDFDYMFTALAPIDLLIQRLGRVHRHPDKGTIREFTKIDSPFTVVIPRSYDNLARIYDSEILNRTKTELSKIKKLNTVDDVRSIIDSAYNGYSPQRDNISRIRANSVTLNDPEQRSVIETDIGEYRSYDPVLPITREERYPTTDVIIIREIKDEYSFAEIRDIMLNNCISVAEYKLNPFHELAITDFEFFRDAEVFVSKNMFISSGEHIMELTKDGLRIE